MTHVGLFAHVCVVWPPMCGPVTHVRRLTCSLVRICLACSGTRYRRTNQLNPASSTLARAAAAAAGGSCGKAVAAGVGPAKAGVKRASSGSGAGGYKRSRSYY